MSFKSSFRPEKKKQEHKFIQLMLHKMVVNKTFFSFILVIIIYKKNISSFQFI